MSVEATWNRILDAWDRALANPNSPVRSKEGLLKQWGALLKETSQRAFIDQQFDGEPWAPLYGGTQKPPFINIAGALKDFDDGRTAPKPNRFQDRPALRDTQTLMNSFSYNVSGKALDYGTVVEYARVHQEGGTVQLDISKEALGRVYRWLWKKKVGDKPREFRKGRSGYAKLWPAAINAANGLHEVEVAKRPFVGIPQETADRMMAALKDYYRTETR